MLKTEVFTISTSGKDDHCIFLNTPAGIYSYSPNFGMMKRTDIDEEFLNDHIECMKAEGCTVKHITVSGGYFD